MNKDKTIRKAYLASGCFWGTEYWFMKAAGVKATAVGFMGGAVERPTYAEVKTGTTGHLECVEVEYDETETDYSKLLTLFFETHDFTQTDGQGPDIGAQYLSCIFYANDEERDLAQAYLSLLAEKGHQVATQLQAASTFWKAEDYHQQYYEHKGAQPYCHSYKKIF